MIRINIFVALLMAMASAPLAAAPGVGEKIYGSTVDAGATEVEARYGRLTGGDADGEDGLVLELAHGFSKNFYAAALIELEREPGEARRVEAYGIEAIAPLGRIDALKLDLALYGEFEHVRGAPDQVEFKALLEHRQGAFDSRLNLTTVKQLGTKNPLELEYAVSADWAVAGEFRLGAAAFGELGTTRDFLPRAEHYAGPIAKFDIEKLPGNSELEVETGYLFAIGAARDETKGQLRLLLEWETHF